MTKQKEHVLHTDKNGIVQFEKPFLLSPAAEYHFTIVSCMKVRVLEIEDCLFNFDSAVFLPDTSGNDTGGTGDQERINGLNVIRSILKQVKSHAEQKVLIAGHTDRSGPEEYNFELSRKRAFVVISVLEADRDSWIKIVTDQNKNEDIQHILKWVAVYKKWNCDPGKIDGIIGSKSIASIKEFQKKSSLEDDGIVGKLTWGAIFDVYQEYLNGIMAGETDSLSMRKSINWAFDCKGVGCGEMWPTTSEMKSETDRRVEVLFFDEAELPECTCSNGSCQRNDCPVYKDGAFIKEYIPLDGASGDEEGEELPDFDPGEEVINDYEYDQWYPIPEGEDGGEENDEELPDFDPGEEVINNYEYDQWYSIPQGEDEYIV